MSLVAELKRRNVFRVAMLYGVASWVLLQVGDLLFGVLGVPSWGIKLLLGLLVLGFPLALIFSWVYELTPEGLKREHEVAPGTSVTGDTGRKINFLIVGLLVVSIGLVLADRFLGRGPAAIPASPATPVTTSAPTSANVAGAAAANVAAIPSIAVLPFVNMSDDKSNEYFSDGLTEELLNVLANVPGLRVIARTSSFAYKGKEAKVADIARDLNVDHVLEGSVRKSGKRVRITAQLIRASDSSHVWSETYDRDLNDVFAVQDEISGQVASALKGQLLQSGSATREIGGTRDPQAYEAYLRGRFLKNQGEGETTLRGALDAFDAAIRLDPKYARAYVGKADTLARLGSNSYMPPGRAFELSRQAAKRAIELAPDLAEAYLSLAFVLQIVDADLHASMAASERALQLNPGSFDVQVAYSGFVSAMGRHEEALAAARRAIELDPVSPLAYGNLTYALIFARRYVDAEAAARRSLELAPDRPSGDFLVGLTLLLQRRTDEALAAFNRETVVWQRDTGRALAFAIAGRTDEARAEMAALQKKLGDDASYQYAEINIQLGNRDEAFRWLENARRVRDPGLMSFIYVDPLLDPLRSDPRYEALVRELGFTSKS